MTLVGDRAFERRELGERPVPLLRVCALVVVVAALHGLLFRRLQVANFGPDFLATLAVVGGLELGVAGGASIGILSGLAADMCTYQPIGVWTFVLGVVGLIFGLVHERAFTGTLRRPPYLLAFLGVLGAELLYPALLVVVSDASFPRLTSLLLLALIVPLWAAVIVVPVRGLVRLIIGNLR